MDLILGNPAGLWALLAVPAVLAVHLLQQRMRPTPVSTLFLLDALAPESVRGRRLDRLRSSIPLWLQLAAVAVVAWLLAEPRWVRADSVERVVIVLDGSASMSAFTEAVSAALRPRLAALGRAAARTELVLLDSDGSTRWAGGDPEALFRALASFEPTRGEHDLGPALLVARELVRSHGVVVLVTDHVIDVPDGVRLLAVGRPLDDVGFTGLVADGAGWQATVRNHGASEEARGWWIESGGRRGAVERMRLRPGETRLIGGVLPDGADALTVALEPDLFTLDDRLPIVRPAPKPLAVYVGADLPDGVGRLVESTEAVRRVERQEDADLAFTLAGRLRATTRAAVVVVDDDRPTETYLPELIVAENEPLVDGLSWQGLLVRDTRALALRPTDRALLWHGKRPLVFLRDADGAQQLWINFDPRHANALRLPAFAVLLGRYVEAVRAARLAPEVRNVETWQRLVAAVDAAGPPLIVRHGGGEERLEAAQAALLHAPGRPGPFEVRQGERLVLGGAAYFADMREADLRHAASFDGLGAAVRAEAVRNSRPDPLAPLWMVVLGGLLLANWKLTG